MPLPHPASSSARLQRGLLGAGLALTTLLASSCGQSAPEGATLRLQFLGVRASAIDSMTVTFTARPGQRFQMRPTEVVDGVTVEVATDGALVLSLPGDYIRSRIVETDPAGLNPQLDLEVWSDDTTTNLTPLVRATVVQSSELVAQGAAYVMDWPLVLGSISTINVMCNAGSMPQCQRM